MPAPKDNQFARKPVEQIHGDSFSLRAPAGTKGRAVACARRRDLKLTTWLLEAVEEKIAREEQGV